MQLMSNLIASFAYRMLTHFSTVIAYVLCHSTAVWLSSISLNIRNL